MTQPIIEVRNLSKRYRLGTIGATRLRDDLEHLWHRVTGRVEKRDESDFWALKNVSFEVQPGEVVGIIGRNGAGKSTLLKILSRITDPTSGEIVLRGRVASLLEVGTGFHADLTGRENIFLNGAILGMTQSEVRRKFDEIVAFAEIDAFIDTPVKRYSSGMYVRLAFAVAAHLDPEILIIDEVLAVGDADFQKKCLGKMQDVTSAGRTVLFVSHNMGMINSLCKKCVLLDGGQVKDHGQTSRVVLGYYTNGRSAPHNVDFTKLAKPPGDELAQLSSARIADTDGTTLHEIDIRHPFRVIMRFRLLKAVPDAPCPNFHFFDARGECIFVSLGRNSKDSGKLPGHYETECMIPGDFLNDGAYSVGLALTFMYSGLHVSFYEKDALSFIMRDPVEETLNDDRQGYSGHIPGVVRPKLSWQFQKIA